MGKGADIIVREGTSWGHDSLILDSGLKYVNLLGSRGSISNVVFVIYVCCLIASNQFKIRSSSINMY